MEKRTLITLLVLLLTSLSIQAQYLVITKSNSDEVNVKLADLRTITFANGNMILNAKDATTSNYAISDVQKMYFSTTGSGLAVLNADEVSISISQKGDELTVFNTGDAQAYIVRIDGAKVYDQRVGETSTINIGMLDRGFYILKVKNKTFKFFKK